MNNPDVSHELSWGGKFHATTKRGPNGPALVMSHVDYQSLAGNPDLFKSLTTFIAQMGLDKMLKKFEQIWSNFQQLPQHPNPLHSRLGFIPSEGGKTRVVAIGDYWTQEACLPLHKRLFKILKSLPTDGTFNQGRIVEFLQRALIEGKPAYCFDLKSATDRFPVELQEIVVAKIIGKQAAKSWSTLLTRRCFVSKFGDVEYSVGQPQGILSS